MSTKEKASQVARQLREIAAMIDAEVVYNLESPQNLDRIARQDIVPCAEQLKQLAYHLQQGAH